MQARRLEGEWLDELPATDPRARRSRADLRRINALMGNARIVASELVPEFVPGTSSSRGTICELGAGDGAFALRVVQLLAEPDVDVTLVDRQRIVSKETLGAFAAARAPVA